MKRLISEDDYQILMEIKKLMGADMSLKEIVDSMIYEGKQISREKSIPKKEWYNLKEACALKGINYHTVSNKSYLKPRNGEPDGIIGGRKAWRKETILEWVNQTDTELKNLYLEKKVKK